MLDAIQLANFNPDDFLQNYWQKKPLLIRGGLPDFQDPLTPEELAGLALEEDIESRIISGSLQHNDWQLELGPFTEQGFQRSSQDNSQYRKDTPWTLLVQAVDHWLPEILELRQRFRFIPDWRIDDVMVSYADTGGSVGPHYDNYDVFLIQGLGKRQWQLGQFCENNEPLLEHESLKILSEFKPQQEYILEVGDILYVPPRLAHYGLALEPALTYSIGFRAPSHSELISHWCDHLLAQNNSDEHLTDAPLTTKQHPSEITTTALVHLKQQMQLLLDHPEAMEDWFAQLVTEPKYDETEHPEAAQPETATSLVNIETLLDQHPALYRSSDCRLAFIRRDGYHALYANGKTIESKNTTSDFIEYLCSSYILESTVLKSFTLDSHNSTLLSEFILRGYLYVESD